MKEFLEVVCLVLSGIAICTFGYSVITRRYNLALLAGAIASVVTAPYFLCLGATFAYSLFYSATVFCILSFVWIGVEVMWFMKKWLKAKRRNRQFNRDFIPSKAFSSFFIVGIFTYIGIAQIHMWLI